MWIDYLRRRLVTSGRLKKLVENDALRGMTSNPKIFEKSIEGTDDYDGRIRALVLKGQTGNEIYETLAIEDVQMAADVFRPLYERREGRDGYVSLEVNPHLVYDTEGTIHEAKRLWKTADRPLMTIQLEDRLDLAQEFLRWEIAVATAGHVIGVNPLDQPSVQESKDHMERLLERREREGAFDEDAPALIGNGLALYGRPLGGTVQDDLHEFFAQAHGGDYVALLAYLPEVEETDRKLEGLRRAIADVCRRPVIVEYGPRYLHSTGQLHKAGTNRGVFLMLTANGDGDLPIPGRTCGFASLLRAQALGDFASLRKRHRRVRRVPLEQGAQPGLDALRDVLDAALQT